MSLKVCQLSISELSFPYLKTIESQSKCFIYSYLDNYFPKERGVCSNPDNLHGRYDSLKLAKIACNRDSHCIGVQDTKCETSGIFKICKTGFRTPAQHSCIHEKQGFNGTCLSIFFLQLMFIIYKSCIFG